MSAAQMIVQSQTLNGRASQDNIPGIGIFLAPNRKGQFMITKISPDGAAFQSKEVEVGDLLVEVDGTILEGMQIEEVRKYITGPPNSRIDLQLLRPVLDQLTGVEEMKMLFVSLIRSVPSTLLSDRDRSPMRFDSPLLNSSKPVTSTIGPIIGQTFAQYTPARLQGNEQQSQKRAPTLLASQNQPARTQSPTRGPGPLYSGIERSSPPISSDVVSNDQSMAYDGSTQRRLDPSAGMYGTEPHYSTVRRSISAPEQRSSWPEVTQNQNQGPARFFTPQRIAPAAKRGASPGAPGIGLYGAGIVLKNDFNGDLRVIDVTVGGPADTQGCSVQIGDIVVAIDGKIIRGIPALQAREMVLGRHGTPVEFRVLRLSPIPHAAFPQFQALSFVVLRGLNRALGNSSASMQASRNSSARHSARTPSPSSYRIPASPRTGPSQRAVAVNEHMCGIGVFIERMRGALIVKSINPNGPAGQVPPTYLFPGDYLVAIDGQNTQAMTMKEVRDKIVGKRGTYVTLSLRRFMPTTGEFSHVFETRIQRELPSPSYIGDEFSESNRPGVGRGPLILQALENSVGIMSFLHSSVELPRPFESLDAEDLSGVGIQLMEVDQVLMVKELQPGSAAERSGLIGRGDVLHRVDYQQVEGRSTAQVMAMLTGPPKTSVVLGFVKPRHRLRVNVRLSREQRQQPFADNASGASNVPFGAERPRETTPGRARVEPVRRDAMLRSTFPTPRQFGTPLGYRPMMNLSAAPLHPLAPFRGPRSTFPAPFFLPGFQPLMMPRYVL